MYLSTRMKRIKFREYLERQGVVPPLLRLATHKEESSRTNPYINTPHRDLAQSIQDSHRRQLYHLHPLS